MEVALILLLVEIAGQIIQRRDAGLVELVQQHIKIERPCHTGTKQ